MPLSPRLAALALFALLLGSAPPCWAADDDPGISDFDVEYDLGPAQLSLPIRAGPLGYDPEAVGSCKSPALQVTKQALDRYDFDKRLRRVLKGAAEGVRDAAKLAGAKKLSKVAQIAGEIVAAYDYDQPEAALGRALVNNAVDWAVEEASAKAKTGKEKVDEKVKDKAKSAGEAAKKKIIDKTFGGALAQRITEDVSILFMGYCSPASVTVEFQKPGDFPRGGLFVLVRGACKCVAQNTAELTSFQVSWFMPLAGMDARLEFDKHKMVADVNELLKSSLDLRKGVRKSLGLMKPGEESEEDKDAEPPDLKKLGKDLAEKAGEASTIKKLKLVLTPRFEMPRLEDINIHAECGCPRQPAGAAGKAVPPPPPPEATPAPTPRTPSPCEKCDGLKLGVEKAEEEARAAQSKHDGAETKVRQMQGALGSARAKLEGLKTDPRFKGGANPGQRRARENAIKQEIARAEKDVEAARAERDALAGSPERARAALDAARKAYEKCLDECRNRTPTGGDPVAGEVDRCLVGRWVSTKFSSQMGHTGFTNILLTFDEKGVATVDYSKSDPRRIAVGPQWTQDTFRGASSSHVATRAGKARRLDTISNDATQTIEMSNGTRRTQNVSAGPAFLGIPGQSVTYNCTKDILTYQTQNGMLSFTYERVGAKTQTGPAK